MSQEEKQRRLKELLELENLNYEFHHPPNIAEPILLIRGYSPSDKELSASFAFTLETHYENNSGGMGSKCWISNQFVRSICDNTPSPHPDYKEFRHCGITYFPFSVNLDEYTYKDAQSLRDLLRNLYSHLVFD